MDGGHVFIDESKRAGYLIVAATASPSRVEASRCQLRGLLLWVADAVAWTWSHGSPWRSMVADLVVESREV